MLFILLQQNSIISTLWMFALIFIVFYFFMIRPQIRKQKIEKKFQENIKKGNYIVTNSGVHGKIIEITNNFFVLETILGKIKLEKNTVSKELTQLRYVNSTNSISTTTTTIIKNNKEIVKNNKNNLNTEKK
ncbi:preprotein translocase subunit YajC [Blattabacterium cuenoti]|uniref:preprotein translocase subunit YajC n=1 Tax=Blattabacterium cuenoti TaxID=1653831 RepID=UPI00163C74C2|nr:preprotein translocase subunit YajC [Blattabacterium cuenoti]